MPLSWLLTLTIRATSCENLQLLPLVQTPLVKSKQICVFGSLLTVLEPPAAIWLSAVLWARLAEGCEAASEDDDVAGRSTFTGVWMPSSVSAPDSAAAVSGLLDKSTRLVMLPLLDVLSCSLLLQSLATYMTFSCG